MAKIINGSSLALALANYLCTNAYLNDTAQDVLIMVGNWIDEAQGITVPKWIPVSERLPGENGDYLVFKGSRYGGWCEVAGFAKDGSEVDEYDLGGCENVWYDYDSEYGYIAFDSVTHWMQLPTPPKEEKNNG